MAFNKSAILARAVGAALVLGGGMAQAALVEISGGSSFSTPGNNNVLGAGYAMMDNATLSTTEDGVYLSFYFVGSESGYDNTLNAAFADVADNFNHLENDTIPGFGAATLQGQGLQSAAGSVAMDFTSNGWDASFILRPGDGDTKRSIAFAYLRADYSVSLTATDIILFALDDDGANADDNHDDYVGIIYASKFDPDLPSPVPIPAAAWLFGSALFGLVTVARRKQQKA